MTFDEIIDRADERVLAATGKGDYNAAGVALSNATTEEFTRRLLSDLMSPEELEQVIVATVVLADALHVDHHDPTRPCSGLIKTLGAALAQQFLLGELHGREQR